jgi:predicted type IV restriction endonuclease
MKEELAEFLQKIKSHPSLLSLGETQAKSGIIEPIIRKLGWDTTIASAEVVLEYPVDQGRIDYCLQADKSNLVFLEAKKPSEDLDRHQDQLLEYAFRRGIRLAVLCNGITWAFYLPLSEGKWQQRRFYTIDIVEQDSVEASSHLIDFLSKENVSSGKAVKNATNLLEGKRRQETISDSMPEAWNRIVSEPDSLLLDLIAERTGKICGFQPTQQDLASFFRHNADKLLLSPQDETPDVPSKPATGPRITTHPGDREHVPIADADKVSVGDLVYEIVKALQSLGGRATKEEVEGYILRKYERVFNLPYYQQTVSCGVPRWQHNIAWAKEGAKKRGLVRWPSESGRGIWELTAEGKALRG